MRNIAADMVSQLYTLSIQVACGVNYVDGGMRVIGKH